MRILRVAAIAAVVAGLLAFLLRTSRWTSSDRGSSAAEPRESSRPTENPEPPAAPRQEPPAEVEVAASAELVASALPTEAPGSPDVPVPIGTEADWEREFAGKSRDDLLRAAEQLRAEFLLECAAEADRRFATGQYEVYAQGEQPAARRSTIYTAARGDELSIRVVEIDVLRDAEICAKERKSTWLLEQARNRP